MKSVHATTRATGPEWPMPRWSMGMWLLFVAGSWWASAAAGLAAGPSDARAGWIGVAFVTLARFAGFALEAGYYATVWKSFGRRLRVGWMFTWITTLSILDMIAESLRRLGAEHPGWAPWLSVFSGLGGRDALGAWPPGLALAAGSLGLLTAARIAATAVLQSREVGCSCWAAAALVTATWIATRIAVWWGIDLLRGMSPLP